MKTIAVLSRKGGAGKTTMAVSLGVAAQQAGLKAVVADIDPLRSAAVVLGGRKEADSILIETSAGRLKSVRDACRRNRCELLIIDTPPAPLGDVVKAIDIADFCLAVARPSALDLAAIHETIELVWKRRRPGLVALNQCQPARNGVETALTRRAIQTLECSRLPIAQTKIRSRLCYQQAAGDAQAVTEFAPGSEAALDLQRLLVEVGERLAADARHDGERSTFEGPELSHYPDGLEESWATSLPLVAAGSALYWDLA